MNDDQHRHETLLLRWEHNPILTAEQWPYPVNTVFNPGAARLKDGSTLLLCRVEERSGLSHLCKARSLNGFDGWEIDPLPTFLHDPEGHPEEVWGVEDPRITWIPESKKFAIAYTSFSKGGPGVSLALTEDFKTFERLGVVMPPEDKDAALLPVRIRGHWAMVHRPMTTLGAHIWISYSPDLVHWGRHRLMLQARRGGWWDANKIGLCGPLIETPKGWLMLYHGVRQTAAGCLYRLGLALMDQEHPEKCLLRGDTWIFGPEAPYETAGEVNNVVFPCGQVIDDDGDRIRIYYGGADTCIAMATGRISTLLQWLEKHGRPDT